ncbi:MAG: hypothetical protein K8W52_16700 [Deltaproteobacteria bacterium]|nr:hypothetical protein [Deltaproteobacteria bacterium]
MSGHARADTDACTTAPVDPATRAMAVEVAAPDGGGPFVYPLFAPAKGSEFPAVSKDGKVIVQLFHEGEDFSGAPITTLMFWSNRGTVIARYSLGSSNAARADGVDAKVPTKAEAALGKAANARLATRRWRPLAVHPACAPADAPVDDSDHSSTVQLDGDVAVTFDPVEQRLVSTRRGRTTKLRATFSSHGTRMGEDSHGGCGQITRLDYGFGGRDLGVAILVPDASLGGDSCFGLPTSDNALAIKLR